MNTDVLRVAVRSGGGFKLLACGYHFLGNVDVRYELEQAAEEVNICSLEQFILGSTELSWEKYKWSEMKDGNPETARRWPKGREVWFDAAACLETLEALDVYFHQHPVIAGIEGIEKYVLQDIRNLAGILSSIDEQNGLFFLVTGETDVQPVELLEWMTQNWARESLEMLMRERSEAIAQRAAAGAV